jgi:hypothetical protein
MGDLRLPARSRRKTDSVLLLESPDEEQLPPQAVGAVGDEISFPFHNRKEE